MRATRILDLILLGGIVVAVVAGAASLGDLVHNFHSGDLGETRFTQTFIAALVAGALALLVLARRSVGARMSRVVVTGGTGIALVGFGLWCAIRPIDMGSYEPNCLPPIFEGSSDERCSDVPRSAGGLVLVGAGALALVVAVRATRRQVD